LERVPIFDQLNHDIFALLVAEVEFCGGDSLFQQLAALSKLGLLWKHLFGIVSTFRFDLGEIGVVELLRKDGLDFGHARVV